MPRGARSRSLALVAVIVVACGSPAPTATLTPSPGPTPSSAPTASGAPSNTPSPSVRPSASPSPSVGPSPTPSPVKTCAQRTFGGLDVAGRVGQLFLLGLAADALGADERAAIADDHFGSVWFTETTTVGATAIRAVADAVQALAPEATDGIGFFVAANQEGGLVQAMKGTGFSTIPTAVQQGKMASPALEVAAAGWGRELQAAGIDLDYAPVSDVVPAGTADQNEPIGVLKREYGHDPTTVGDHAAAFVRGMAGDSLLTVAKHFPGLGRVVGNTDTTAGVIDTVTTAHDPNLAAFQEVIDAGVPFVMVALATYTQIDPDAIAAFSPTIIGSLLRSQLGFTGIVMSDDLGATTAVADIPPATRAIDFITAGGEMIIAKTIDPAKEMEAGIIDRMGTDATFRAQVYAAVRHVLDLKDRAGLLPCDPH